jgi:AhpD family alkylhydroperoxidase
MRFKPFLWIAGVLALTGSSAWLVSQLLKRTNVVARGGNGRPASFGKRILPGPVYLRRELDYWLNHPEEIKALYRGERVSQAFAERLILAVTGVNRCRYCAFGHTRSASHLGMEQEEIEQLLAGDLSEVDPDEVEALAFAIHYAETGGRPDLDALLQLRFRYGVDTARDIQTAIRLIMLANLVGNTFDAFISRLRGRPAPESTWQSEVASLGLLIAGFVPYSVALGLRLSLAETPGAVRPNVFVLQE